MTIEQLGPADESSLAGILDAEQRVTFEPDPMTLSFEMGSPILPLALGLVILDETLIRAPTSLQIMVMDAEPDSTVDVYIGANLVWTLTADGEGNIAFTSIPVEGLNAGTHVVTVTSSNRIQATATFTLSHSPLASPMNQSSDAAPVAVPEAALGDGRYKWVLQDLKPGGLGSWVMPVSPNSASPKRVRKTLTTKTTTTGVPMLFEGHLPPMDWQFSGYCPNRAFYEQLVAFSELNRRFYVIDHRNQAWKVAIAGLDFTSRRRENNSMGGLTDHAGDYTVSAVVYEQTPTTPE